MNYTRLVSGTSLILICIALALSGASARARREQNQQTKKEEQAFFLVARRGLSDPFFQESVVVMLPLPETPLIVGLIINKKPTRLALREVFPDDAALKDRSEVMYFGGPVDLHAPGVVFRSPEASKQATHLFGDFYVSFDSHFIKELLEKPEPGRDLRLFLGRSQWAPGQLQNEMLRGGWYSVRAEANLIFSPDPQNVWRMLLERVDVGTIARSELQRTMDGPPYKASAQR